MGFATVLALIYIHMQTQIFQLAYQGKAREKIVGELMDNNGALTHHVMSLKSADNLGRELLEKDKGMQFIEKNRVMTLYSRGVNAQSQTSQKTPPQGEKFVSNVLSFLSPAEARAWDR